MRVWLALLLLAACEPVGSQQGYEPEQPVAFSHALHAGEYGVDCQYCHTGAEVSRHAGVPAVETCMNCHAKVKTESPEIQKLAAAWTSGAPIQWIKVHRLPDFAWFNHGHHVGSGLACQTCHGPVETMVRVRQVETMTMGWCLSCHRQTKADPTTELDPPTDCSACHY